MSKEEFDLDKLDKRIEHILDSYCCEACDDNFAKWVPEVKQLLRDFSKYVTPERPALDVPPGTTIGNTSELDGYDKAISEIEANTRKVLGDE